MTSTTSVSFEIGDPVKYKAFIEPDDLATYQNWIPEGPKLPTESGKGNTLRAHVVLVNAQTQQPVEDKFKTTYHLRDVSHLGGWCTNYPQRSAGGSDYNKDDLRFEADSNPSTATVSGDQRQLDTADDKGDDTITVTSTTTGLRLVAGASHAQGRDDD